jgi:hypothetical protein
VTSRIRRNVTIAFAVVVTAFVGSWAVIGGRALTDAVPEMLRADLAEWTQDYRKGGQPFPPVILVEEPYARSLGPRTFSALGAVCREFGLSLHVYPDLPPGVMWQDQIRCIKCFAFTHEVVSNFPLWGEVFTIYGGEGGRGDVVFSHRLIWGFGAWIRISRKLEGMG